MEDVKLQRMTKAQLIEKLEYHHHRETLFRDAERIANIGYYEWNYDLDRLESCSEEYAHIFNMSVDEVLAAESSWENTLQEIHPDDRERYKAVSKELRDTHSLDVEFRIIRNDGEIRHVRESGVVVVDDDGKECSSFGILQDITDQVGQQQVLEYRDLLSQQVEAIADIGHFVFDEIAEFYLHVSDGFARIHGLTAEQYIKEAQSLDSDLVDVHPDDKARVRAVYEKFRIDHEDYSVEYRFLRRDGELRWVRERCSAHRIDNGAIELSLGALQDITDLKNSESQLIEANNLLETKVERRTRELAHTVRQLQEASETLEAMVEERTRELENTVSQLQDEITEREKIAAELKFLANHDTLTGLPSLRLCKDRLDRSLAESRRNNLMSVVMFVDLDGFKAVNDTYGHESGDDALKITADRIKAEIRETDTVARIGGDEFLVILSQISDIVNTRRIAENIIKQISQVIQIGTQRVAVGASIGISIYPEDGTTSEELIRQADKAMYLVKNSGKNNFGYTSSTAMN